MAVPGPRQDVTVQSTLSRDVLDSPETLQCIALIRELVSSSLGPHGRLKTIQNTCGGHLTLTSSSQRLLSALSVSKPVLKLIVGSVQSHLATYRDGGQFAANLCLNMIEASMALNMSKRLVVDIFDCLLKMAVDYLKDEEFPCKFSLKDAGLGGLLKLTRSILRTKPLCCLYGANLEHMERLIVEAFLKSLPESADLPQSPENVHFLQSPGHPVLESCLFNGVLLDLYGRGSISPVSMECITNCSENCAIPVAVVNISMAGDLEDFVEAASYDLADDISVDAVSMSRLRSFVEALVQAGTKVVFCQKVVCPDTKTFLQKKKILVVDRLGAAGCKTVQQLTGARLISVISDVIDEGCLGQLTSLSVQVLHDQSYLLLTGPSACDVTVVLCHKQGEGTQEVQSVCEAAIQSLYLHLYQPHVLTGGGCWQTHLAEWLRLQVLEQAGELMLKYYCSKSQLLSVTDAFCNSLQQCAILIGGKNGDHMIDSTNHHLWRDQCSDWLGQGGDRSNQVLLSCQCGLVRETKCVRLQHLDGKEALPVSDSIGRLKAVSCIGFARQQQNSVENKHQYLNDVSVKERTETENAIGYPESLAVVDSFPVQLNALQTAVTTSMAVLSICQYIRDTN